MTLDREQATYERAKPGLLETDAGKYVLIKGDEIIGTYYARDEALAQGARRFGMVPFMVKRIVEVEPVYFVSRPLVAPNANR